MQGVYDTVFGNVTLSGLAAAFIFGVILVVLKFRELSEQIESSRNFQREIANKVTELEGRLNAISERL